MHVIFVCTGNTCRSPMAEGLLNARRPDHTWQASSAGLAAWPDQPPTSQAVLALREGYGIDISQHRSQRLDQSMLTRADLILTMNREQRDYLRERMPARAASIQTIGEQAGEPQTEVPDPYGSGQFVYNQTAAVLARLVDRILARPVGPRHSAAPAEPGSLEASEDPVS